MSTRRARGENWEWKECGSAGCVGPATHAHWPLAMGMGAAGRMRYRYQLSTWKARCDREIHQIGSQRRFGRIDDGDQMLDTS